jgi:hypothetical protein
VQYDVYLTEPEQNEESAERPLVGGLDGAIAQQLCRALNEGGYLRPGLVARSVNDGKPTSTNPVTVQALRGDWIDRPGLTEDDKAALAALPDEDLQEALDEEPQPQPQPGTLVRADLFPLKPEDAGLLAGLVADEGERLLREIGDSDPASDEEIAVRCEALGRLEERLRRYSQQAGR